VRVLMIAPQPFFAPRGTPFSVLNRCRALTALGHEVDLVTYPIGTGVDIPGLRIIRAPRVPGITRVKIGPSLAKIPLDTGLLLTTLWQLRHRGRYDVIHTHEEAGVFGWWLHRVARLPHVYDMHSDLAQQLTNFGFGRRHPLTRCAAWLERHVLGSAAGVIVICQDLADRVATYAPAKRPVLIENAPLDPPSAPGAAHAWRARFCPGAEPLVLYAGTLEPYQGIPLLIEAFAQLDMPGTPPRLALVGGRDDQIEELRALASRCGVSERVSFVGRRPPGEMPACLAAADVLVSPRSGGTNTPLKIYAYLQSGRPIVATRRLTHTQVLDDDVALLTEPSAAGIADGITALLGDAALAKRLGDAARARAEERYSTRSFVARTAEAYAQVGAQIPTEAAINAATTDLEAA